jgi:peptide-methionine (R)-S-oxide reductase
MPSGDNVIGVTMGADKEQSMLRNRWLTCLFAGALLAFALAGAAAPKKKTDADNKNARGDEAKAAANAKKSEPADDTDKDGAPKKVVKTDAEWRKILTPMQFRVARKKGTEPAFGPGYQKFKKEGEGTYKCICCGQTLFESNTSFDSGTGWPSFYQPVDEKAINRIEDTSDGTLRIEVECRRCDGHLGHVFSDGPPPTGERFCMNYASLKFVPKDGADKKARGKDKKGPKAKSSTDDDQ